MSSYQETLGKLTKKQQVEVDKRTVLLEPALPNDAIIDSLWVKPGSAVTVLARGEGVRLHENLVFLSDGKIWYLPDFMLNYCKCQPVALSLKQPWLFAVTDLGKDVENRTWRLPAHCTGVRVLLHASKADDPDGVDIIEHITNTDNCVPRDLPRQAIVASAIFVRDITRSDSKWFFGPHGWVIRDVIKLPRPAPYPGKLNFWRVPSGMIKFIGSNNDGQD